MAKDIFKCLVSFFQVKQYYTLLYSHENMLYYILLKLIFRRNDVWFVFRNKLLCSVKQNMCDALSRQKVRWCNIFIYLLILIVPVDMFIVAHNHYNTFGSLYVLTGTYTHSYTKQQQQKQQPKTIANLNTNHTQQQGRIISIESIRANPLFVSY